MCDEIMTVLNIYMSKVAIIVLHIRPLHQYMYIHFQSLTLVQYIVWHKG